MNKERYGSNRRVLYAAAFGCAIAVALGAHAGEQIVARHPEEAVLSSGQLDWEHVLNDVITYDFLGISAFSGGTILGSVIGRRNRFEG